MVLQNSTSIVLQQCQNKVSFQRKGSSVVIEILLNLLKGWQCFLLIRAHLLPFETYSENFNTVPEPFL